MALLVSTGHCAFLLSQTSGLFLACQWISFSACDSTAESGGQFTHAHNSDHCIICLSRAGQKLLCISLQHTNNSAHLSASHTPGKPGQAFVDI